MLSPMWLVTAANDRLPTCGTGVRPAPWQFWRRAPPPCQPPHPPAVEAWAVAAGLAAAVLLLLLVSRARAQKQREAPLNPCASAHSWSRFDEFFEAAHVRPAGFAFGAALTPERGS